jgi:hypothetical protein
LNTLWEAETLPRARSFDESHPKTLGKEGFAESQPKTSGQTNFFSERKKTLDKEETLGKCFFKRNHFLKSKLFISSTYTYIRLRLNFGTNLALFVIFNNFTSF